MEGNNNRTDSSEEYREKLIHSTWTDHDNLNKTSIECHLNLSDIAMTRIGN